MLARLPLRTKLILVVSIPLLVILGFAGFGISDRLGDLDRQRQYGRLQGPNDALVDAQRALENEGVLTTWFVASKGDPAAGTRLDRARDRTDLARREVQTAKQGLADDDVSAATQRAWRELVERMTLLDSVRRQANQFSGLPSAFAATYSTVAGDAIDVSARLAHDVDDRQLTVRMLAIVQLRREQAAYAAEAMVVIPYLATGTSTPAQLNDWIRTVREQEDAADAFAAAATPDARSVRVRELNAALDDPFRDGVDDPPDGVPRGVDRARDVLHVVADPAGGLHGRDRRCPTGRRQGRGGARERRAA